MKPWKMQEQTAAGTAARNLRAAQGAWGEENMEFDMLNLKRAVRGDERAFEALIEPYADATYRLCLRHGAGGVSARLALPFFL